MPTLTEQENPPQVCVAGRPKSSIPRRHRDEVWYLLYTRSRQEKETAWALKVAKLTYYLPMASYASSAAGRPTTTHKPLFPGYLFVCAPPHDFYGRMIQTPRRRHLVTHQPVLDPTLLETQLRDLYRASEHLPPYQISPRELQVGKRVEFIDGALAGLTAKISATPTRRTAKLLVVELDVQMLGAAHFQVDLSQHAVRLLP